MRLLLDTNIVIPIIDGSGRNLPAPIVAVLQNDGSDLHVSVASIWEIAIKHRLGKLPLSGSLHLVPEALRSLRLHVLTVRTAHVIAPVDLPAKHKDPFDRLMIGICGVERCQLVTLDKKLITHPLAWRPPSA